MSSPCDRHKLEAKADIPVTLRHRIKFARNGHAETWIRSQKWAKSEKLGYLHKGSDNFLIERRQNREGAR